MQVMRSAEAACSARTLSASFKIFLCAVLQLQYVLVELSRRIWLQLN